GENATMRRVRTPDGPFLGGTAFDSSRPLRIVLDDALGAGEAADLLRGFARHDLVEVFAKGEAHNGAALLLSDLDEHGNLPYDVRRRTGTLKGALGNAQQWDAIAVQMTEEWGAANADDARRELILAQIARAVGAD